MRVSYEGEVTVVPWCEMFHQSHCGRNLNKYNIYYIRSGSHAPALLCIIAQKQIQGRRCPHQLCILFSEPRHLISEFIRKVCFHAGQFRVNSEVQQL